MFTHPYISAQLASEHRRELLAQASQRQLRHQHGRPALGTPARPRIPDRPSGMSLERPR